MNRTLVSTQNLGYNEINARTRETVVKLVYSDGTIQYQVTRMASDRGWMVMNRTVTPIRPFIRFPEINPVIAQTNTLQGPETRS